MAVVVSGSAFLLWNFDRLWINLAAPLALIILDYGSITAADFLQSELERRRTRAMFSRYVSPAVVDEIMKDPTRVALGGERMMVTVMFTDIRGFTAYSEKKQPEVVVQRLNQYLTATTKLILEAEGTLDKYLGDGLMAVFGAPIPLKDHVQRAIRVAEDIEEAVRKLNEYWVAAGEIPLQVGVGINSGPALMGNVGSPERMEYTAIGEDVNLASRVEGLTKNFGTLVCISERSVQLLSEEERQSLGLRYVGQAEVKGFTEPVGVYTVGDYRLDK
jgi:adenylate cyclase